MVLHLKIPYFKIVRTIKLLAILVSTLFTGLLHSQTYRMEITPVLDKSGAPPSATFAIIEDRQGFIWFGTIDGLYRYDGFNYKIFRNEPENKNSLSNNTIRDLAIDKNGTIWIATQGGGLDAFDPVSESFTNYNHSGTNENELSGNSLWSIIVDRHGNIYAGVSGQGVDRVNPQTGEIKHYSVLENGQKLMQEESVRSLLEASDGSIWAGISNLGVSKINPNTSEVKQYLHEYGNTTKLSNDQPFDLYLGHDGNIWIASFGGGINILDPETESFRHIRANNNTNTIISDLTYSIDERIEQEYWIATEYGISVYNNKTGEIRNFQQSSGREAISENRVRKIFIDSKGIVWAGTESGVDKFVLQSNFITYSNYLGNTSDLSTPIVKAICKDDENLWIGLIDNGLIRYNYPTKSYKQYTYEPNQRNSLSGSNINSIFIDSEKTMWVSDWNTGLMKYDPKGDNFERVSNAYQEQNRLSDNRIQRIIEGKPGVLWISTEGGLNKYDVKSDKFFRFQHDAENPNSLSSNSLQSQAIVFDSDSNLWLGTWSFGLNKMVFKNKERKEADFVHYRHEAGNNKSLPNDNVISLLYDTTCLWIGTFGGGLSRLDFVTNEFTTYTTENGLPNNIIFAIYKDKNGNLWLSTDYGISMFNPSNEQFQNYTKKDGLQDNHFFWGAAYADKNGILYFGGINGLNSFVPEEVTPDTTPAPPVLVDIKLFNQSVLLDRLEDEKNSAKFFYDENFISLEFAALDYSEPDKNLYKYKLEGFDKDWIIRSGSNRASYTNLSPGSYSFKLQVSNSDGIWNKETLELQLAIIPPWWKTWFARIAFIVFMLVIIYGIYKIRIDILQSQKRQLEDQVKLRTAEIAEKNKTLNNQKDEISTQNQQLNKQKDELAERNGKLRKALTELENTQKALVESEKLASLGILTAGVAHEINNPLNFISVSIENIKSSIGEIECIAKETSKEKLDEINELLSHSETGVTRITQIVAGLKSLLSNSEENLELVQADELINSATTVLAHKIPKYIKLNVALNTKTQIQARKFRLSQVFINIIDNAIDSISTKPIHENECIDIEIDTDNYENTPCVVFKIANSGPPIPEEELSKIFDPFFTTKDPNKGTGLGLYITYSIIKEHNGYIHVKNEKGKVVFYIFVPILDDIN
jgi:signal transduction histidine kinase/ligand-binding sensor domain-containing protein